MRRGRWVVYCITLFLLFFVPRSTLSSTLGVTAKVLLSQQWKEALRTNSEAKMDTSRARVLYSTQYSLGIEKMPVEDQTIQFLVFKNGKVVDEQEKRTNKSGFVDFVFISEETSTYMVIIINKTDTSPFIVKSSLLTF